MNAANIVAHHAAAIARCINIIRKAGAIINRCLNIKQFGQPFSITFHAVKRFWVQGTNQTSALIEVAINLFADDELR